MTEHKLFTDEEIIRAFDILDKFEFFGGQRAGRELWFNKPTDIQNKDIGNFLRDLDFLKQFINRQEAELKDLRSIVFTDRSEAIQNLKAEAVKEFAERLKTYYRNLDKTAGALIEYHIDQKVKEFLEGDVCGANTETER